MFFDESVSKSRNGCLGIGPNFEYADILVVFCRDDIDISCENSINIRIKGFDRYFPKKHYSTKEVIFALDSLGFEIVENNWEKLSHTYGTLNGYPYYYVPFLLKKGSRIKDKINYAKKLFDENFNSKIDIQIAKLERKREVLLESTLEDYDLNVFNTARKRRNKRNENEISTKNI